MISGALRLGIWSNIYVKTELLLCNRHQGFLRTTGSTLCSTWKGIELIPLGNATSIWTWKTSFMDHSLFNSCRSAREWSIQAIFIVKSYAMLEITRIFCLSRFFRVYQTLIYGKLTNLKELIQLVSRPILIIVFIKPIFLTQFWTKFAQYLNFSLMTIRQLGFNVFIIYQAILIFFNFSTNFLMHFMIISYLYLLRGFVNFTAYFKQCPLA